MKYKIGDIVEDTENGYILEIASIRSEDKKSYGCHGTGDAGGYSVEANNNMRESYPQGNFTRNEEQLELITKHVPKVPTHVIVWDTDCGDPHKEVYSEKEAKDELLKLFELRNVVKSTIKVFKVSEVKTPIMKIGLTKI